MSEGAQRRDPDCSYGELLGEYFDVVNEIAPMLDASGRPDPERYPEYARLRQQKTRLLTGLERAAPEFEETEIQPILDEAFEDD